MPQPCTLPSPVHRKRHEPHTAMSRLHNSLVKINFATLASSEEAYLTKLFLQYLHKSRTGLSNRLSNRLPCIDHSPPCNTSLRPMPHRPTDGPHPTLNPIYCFTIVSNCTPHGHGHHARRYANHRPHQATHYPMCHSSEARQARRALALSTGSALTLAASAPLATALAELQPKCSCSEQRLRRPVRC